MSRKSRPASPPVDDDAAALYARIHALVVAARQTVARGVAFPGATWSACGASTCSTGIERTFPSLRLGNWSRPDGRPSTTFRP